jgi:ribosomal protein S18 acetylase RimI-like enzyme
MYILTLAVTSSYRRRGLASQLLAAALAHAASNPSCGAIYLHVIAHNESALRFYERHGFGSVGVLPSYYLFGGKQHDAYLLVRYANGASRPLGLLEAIAGYLGRAAESVRGWIWGEGASNPSRVHA